MKSSRTERVLQILNFAVRSHDPVKLKDISDALGLHPSIVSRIVADLISGGMLTKCTYHSVIPSPALAMLGEQAGKNHPVARIANEVLTGALERMGLYGALSTLEMDSFYHFFMKWGKPPFNETIWRSDSAAMIFAAMPEQEAENKLRELIPAGNMDELEIFINRIREGAEKRYLINFNAGRLWQLTLPVQCGSINCALTVARVERPGDNSIFSECSRLVSKIHSAYENWKNSLC